MTSGKRGGKYKTNDNSILIVEEEDKEPSYLADEDEMIERLIEEGDEDALMVSEFESTANEILQEDPHLFSAYTEARRKLSEKFRFRGFFPMSKGKGKPGGEGWGKESTIGSKVVIGSL